MRGREGGREMERGRERDGEREGERWREGGREGRREGGKGGNGPHPHADSQERRVPYPARGFGFPFRVACLPLDEARTFQVGQRCQCQSWHRTFFCFVVCLGWGLVVVTFDFLTVSVSSHVVVVDFQGVRPKGQLLVC